MFTDPSEARVHLAACYRLIAHFNLSETIYNHISIRLPGSEEHFLINPFGLMYHEITASSLVTVDVNGDIVDDPQGLGVNKAGFVIHSAIHQARHDVTCVIHTHSIAGMGVSCQADGLLPLTQHAAFMLHDIGYHDSEGVALNLDERARIAASLGDKYVLILRNHGLLTAGRTIVEALQLMIDLDVACRAQVAALAGGRPLTYLSEASLERSASVGRIRHTFLDRDWNAFMRLADQVSPGFRD